MWASEGEKPEGDKYFTELFAPVFKELAAAFPEWDNGTRLTPTAIDDGERGVHESYLQNFSFSYRGYHFVCADFTTRFYAHLLGKEAADLLDIPGGTLPWLRTHLSGYPGKGDRNILIFAHHPLTKSVLNRIFSFPPKEHDEMVSYLTDPGNKGHIGLWAAGHLHNSREYVISKYGSKAPGFSGLQAGPSFKGQLQLITVWGARP